jgi:hypothetical protein
MIYARWNSPESIRRRIVNNVTNEAKSFGYTVSNDAVDTTYTQGQLLEHAEMLLKDAVNDSLSRDLREVAKVHGALKAGNLDAYSGVVNTKDFGMGTDDQYEMPKDWTLPVNWSLWDQRDRLNKAAALIIMEIERLDRLHRDGRNLGYGIFNSDHKTEKKEADAAFGKQAKARRKQEQLDIYQQFVDTAPSFTIAGSNVTASSQSQFSGTVQPMPQAVPCPVH